MPETLVAGTSNRKYWFTAALLYLSYFVLGFSLFAQAQFKPALAAQWSTSIEGVFSAIAWMMVGRLIAYPLAGPVADRVSRRLGAIIGAVLLAASFLGIIVVGSPTLGVVMCIVAGMGNGFLDPAVYPALSEIFPAKAHTANLFLKFAILVAQFLLPLLITWTGGAGYDGGFRAIYIGGTVLLALVILGLAVAPFPPNGSKAAESADSDAPGGARFSSTMVMILGATTITTFTLWGNTNQELGKAYGMSDPAITQSWYAAGAMVAILVSTALLTRVRVTQIIVFYPLISAITLLAVYFIHSARIVPIAGFLIGWTAAGGVLQLVTSLANSLFPQSRGLMTSLVMIASAVGAFGFQQLAKGWVRGRPGQGRAAQCRGHGHRRRSRRRRRPRRETPPGREGRGIVPGPERPGGSRLPPRAAGDGNDPELPSKETELLWSSPFGPDHPHSRATGARRTRSAGGPPGPGASARCWSSTTSSSTPRPRRWSSPRSSSPPTTRLWPSSRPWERSAWATSPAPSAPSSWEPWRTGSDGATP